jgi:hypothetical protein
MITPASTVMVTWYGPFSLHSGASNSIWTGPVSGQCGIYLWAVPAPCGLLAYRIGETGKPFWLRHHEHFQAFGRGEHVIHRASSLAAGRRDPLHRPLAGTAGQRARQRHRFLNQKPRLEAELRATLAMVSAFLAPLDAGLRVRRRIEAELVTRLRAAGPAASALLEFRRGLCQRLESEQPIVVRSRAKATVLGLAAEFEA